MRAALVALAAGCVLSIVPNTAQAADDYPYRDADAAELDERGFYYRHCTSFVAWRLSLRGEFHNHMHGGHWWHARNWAANAEQLGFAVDAIPAPGAIAHWYAGEQGADELGHVAIVEAVHADGSVTVEEYNGAVSLGYSQRGPMQAPRYIHVYDEAPAPASVTVDTPEPVRAELNSAPVVVAATSRATSPEIAARAVDGIPTGRLTEPTSDAVVRVGQTLTVAGRFADDSSVSEVRFFATDNKDRWEPIGTDGGGGNGAYAVRWKVSYPAGSRISFYAEAIDDEGNRSVESISGLEGIRVRRAPAAPKATEDYGRSVSFEGESRHTSPRGLRVLSLAPPLALFLISGVSLGREARRRVADPAV